MSMLQHFSKMPKARVAAGLGASAAAAYGSYRYNKANQVKAPLVVKQERLEPRAPRFPYVQQAQQQRMACEEKIHQWTQGRQRFEQNKAIFDNGIKERDKYLEPIPTTKTMLPMYDGTDQEDNDTNREIDTDTTNDDETKDANKEGHDTDADVSLTLDYSGNIQATSVLVGETSRNKGDATIQNELDDLETKKRTVGKLIEKMDDPFPEDQLEGIEEKHRIVIEALEDLIAGLDFIAKVETSEFVRAATNQDNFLNNGSPYELVKDEEKILIAICLCQEFTRRIKRALSVPTEELTVELAAGIVRECKLLEKKYTPEIGAWLRLYEKELDASIDALKKQ